MPELVGLEKSWISYKIRNIENTRMIRMVKVASAEFQKNIGRYQDMALTQPILVTRNGRDRTVLISAEEYQRLKRRDREVLSIHDLSDEDIEALKTLEPPPEAAQYNYEVE
ncbi:MAG TPA: type II toxin-antitoxin system Phd/YefM family antitoxin [Rhizomicrobium sp.]|jgi:prevent-host-death family protein